MDGTGSEGREVEHAGSGTEAGAGAEDRGPDGLDRYAQHEPEAEKHERFREKANREVARVRQGLKNLEDLADTRRFDYSAENVRTIESALRAQVEHTVTALKRGLERHEETGDLL